MCQPDYNGRLGCVAMQGANLQPGNKVFFQDFLNWAEIIDIAFKQVENFLGDQHPIQDVFVAQHFMDEQRQMVWHFVFFQNYSPATTARWP